MKLTVGIPLVFSITAFALALVALIAGKDRGMMEDYHIVVFNTSTLGHNYISSLVDGSSTSPTPTPTPTLASDSGGIGGFFSSLEASATAIVGSIESEAASILNDIGNDIADKLADELGIEEFYSLHVLDTCRGNYAPNATASDASYNVTSCTAPLDFSSMNVSATLELQLSIGPFDLSLSDLGISPDIQSKLNDLPKLFEALAAMYIISVIFSGLAILGSLAGFFLVPSAGRTILVVNFLLASSANFFLLVGSLLTTVGGNQAKDKIKDNGGDDIGLVIHVGKKFQALTWTAFALMILATNYWVWEFVVATRARRRGEGASGGRRGKDEKHSVDSQHSGGPFKKG